MRQEYPLEVLQSIADSYPSLGKITKHHLFTSGFENTNYYLKTTIGEYVLKIFEGKELAKENIFFEIDVMVYCSQQGCKTPKLLKTKTGCYHTLVSGKEEKLAIMMNFIAGKNMFMKPVTDTIVRELGKETGKMDKVMQHFKNGKYTRQDYEWDLKNFLKIEETIALLPQQFDKQMMKDVFNRFRRQQKEFMKLPTGLIHNDIAAHNILAEKNKLKAIVDFSDLAFSPYIQNIAVFCCQTLLSYHWNPQQIPLFFKAYQEQRKITKEELSMLYDLILARYATIIIEFNRWNVVYEKDQQREKYVNDNYQFLQRFLKISSKFYKEFASHHDS